MLSLREKLLEAYDYDHTTGLFTRKRFGLSQGSIVQPQKNGYIYLTVDGKNQYGHRMAWLHYYGVEACGPIDHRDGDPSNNRIDRYDSNLNNLRLSGFAGNVTNSRPSSRNKTGVKGVQFIEKLGLYRVRIQHQGKVRSLGCYKTLDEAAEVYSKAAKLYFGEFVREARTCLSAEEN